VGPGDVRLWQDGAIFQLVGRMIDSAHARVLVEMYELGRTEIVASLGAAKARGVVVRVITDPTVRASRDSSGQLDLLGVASRAYPIDDGRHQIDHVKLLIADAEAAVGGMNWGRHSERNHDYVLETRVAADVDRLALVFEQDWALAGGHPAPLPAWTGAVAQTFPGTGIRDVLEAALGRAARRVLAEVYTLTDPAVIAELDRESTRRRRPPDPGSEPGVQPLSVLAASLRGCGRAVVSSASRRSPPRQDRIVRRRACVGLSELDAQRARRESRAGHHDRGRRRDCGLQNQVRGRLVAVPGVRPDPRLRQVLPHKWGRVGHFPGEREELPPQENGEEL